MKRLNRDELLKKLNFWFKNFGHTSMEYDKKHDQAYQQIKELIQNNKDGRLEVTEEWIGDKVLELFVILNILKPSINDERNVRTFIRLLYREAGCLVE